MPENSYQLTVRKGPQSQVGQSYPLLGQTITLGRDSIADIVITDPEVSRQHVRLTETDQGYEIQDLGSTNGTFIEGRRLGGGAQLLSPGQIIMLGSNVTLIFEPADTPAATMMAAESGFSLEDDERDIREGRGRGVGIYDVPPVTEPEEMVVEEMVTGESAGAFTFEEEVDQELPSFDEPDEYEDDFELPSFDEPREESFELPSFNQLPDMENDLENEVSEYGVYEEDEALPDFGASVADDYPAPEKIAARGEQPPPPPPPPGKVPGKQRNRNLIIAAVVIGLLLCCCCMLLLLWYSGDALLYELNLY